MRQMDPIVSRLIASGLSYPAALTATLFMSMPDEAREWEPPEGVLEAHLAFAVSYALDDEVEPMIAAVNAYAVGLAARERDHAEDATLLVIAAAQGGWQTVAEVILRTSDPTSPPATC